MTGQIRALRAAVPRGDPGGRLRIQLIELLTARGEFAGRFDDLDAAAAVADAFVAEEPGLAASWLARAGVRCAFHRFDDAGRDLDSAARLGADPERVARVRASILAARGHVQAALDLLRSNRKGRASIRLVGVEAALLGQLGRDADAAARFRDARARYSDVSPFPVAWVLFQQGLLHQQASRSELAGAFFQAALDRVPSYAHAAAHLAPLVSPARAVAFLEPLLGTSDDPEVALALSLALREQGETARADRLLADVKARYAELVRRHSEAFADHAGRFWLDHGDPARALTLARLNLAVRKTQPAYELAILDALAAGGPQAACALGTEGRAQIAGSPMLGEVVSDACGHRPSVR